MAARPTPLSTSLVHIPLSTLLSLPVRTLLTIIGKKEMHLLLLNSDYGLIPIYRKDQTCIYGMEERSLIFRTSRIGSIIFLKQ